MWNVGGRIVGLNSENNEWSTCGMEEPNKYIDFV